MGGFQRQQIADLPTELAERDRRPLTMWVRQRLEDAVAAARAAGTQLGPRARWGHAGKLMQPWNVVENVPRDVLISPGDQGRRRVVFRSKEAAT